MAKRFGRDGLGSILEVSGSQKDKNRVLDEFTKQKSEKTPRSGGQSILYRSLIPEGSKENGQFTNFEQMMLALIFFRLSYGYRVNSHEDEGGPGIKGESRK